MDNRPFTNKAWFFVLPVFILVAISAIIPIMTVVNYSVQDTFGNNVFFWAGTEWFTDVLHSERFHDALGRNLLFSFIILAIEVPLGIAIALSMQKGPGCSGMFDTDGTTAANSLECSWHDMASIWSCRHRLTWSFSGRTGRGVQLRH